MRAVPIEDAFITPGSVRKTIAPPNGDLTSDECLPCDALIDVPSDEGMFAGIPRYRMRIKLEEGELERLQETGHLWLSIWGGSLVPFALSTEA